MEFLTDEQMAKLEQGSPDMLTDEEMAGLEAKAAKPKTPSDIMREIKADASKNDWGGAMNNALSVMTGGVGDVVKRGMGGRLVEGARMVGGTQALPTAMQGFAGRAATSGAVGAAQSEGTWEDRLKGFLTGGAIQGGSDLAAGALKGVGDVAMQLAVGAKKFGKGEGTALANEGVWGTRGMMREQVDKQLADSYEQTLKAASAPTMGPINQRAIGNAVYDDVAGPLTGRSRLIPSEADMPVVERAMNFADDIRENRNTDSIVQALDRRRNAGKRAYRESDGMGKKTVIGELSKAEQAHYSRALKEADPTGEIAKNDARYAALKPAQRALKEKPSLSGMGIVSKPLTLVGGALPTSILGQASTKGAQTLEEFLAPLVRQAATNRRQDK